MSKKKTIYHVVQQRDDPSWDDWSVYKDGRFCYSAWRLREVREGHNTKLKRGFCPHYEGEICGFNKDDEVNKRFRNWAFYWFEVEE